jgi:lysozyme family protein
VTNPTTDVQACIAALIAREGGYTNDPADSGGATCWGITEAVARAYGYKGDMHALPIDNASAIYVDRYWVTPRFSAIDAIDPALAAKLLDAGVNCGPVTASRWLQRALNSLNDGGTRFPDLAVDGHLGPMSLQALRLFVAQRGDDGRMVLLGMIRAQQSVAYIEDAERRPASERFEYGWQRSRAML